MSLFGNMTKTAFSFATKQVSAILKDKGLGLLGDVILGGSQKAVEAVTATVTKSTGVDIGDIIKTGRAVKEEEQKALAQYESDNADMLKFQIEQDTERQRIINETMRIETQSDSKFKSGWRPSIGWVMAYQFFMITNILFGGFAFAIFSKGLTIANFFSAFGKLMGECTVLFMAESSALGINMILRSKDKKMQAGDTSPGFIGGLLNKMKS